MERKIVLNTSRVKNFLELLVQKGVVEAYKLERVIKPWGERRYKVWIKTEQKEGALEVNTIKEIFAFIGSFLGGKK